ncbi:ISL3 family transposase [Kineococcus arenarius]|uniref:ISL3 family transposase n=1 Tax=Kineococcus sp. SYSU DK007 TaxID=3383128 RepID=UPI003D7CECC8
MPSVCRSSVFEHAPEHARKRAPASCAVADELLGLEGLRLLAFDRLAPSVDAEHPRGLLRLTIQTDPPAIVACHRCGVLTADHGRREHRLADAPAFGTPVQLIWRKRRWRCREPRCPAGAWSEEHPALPVRAKLTARAVAWATQTLRWDDSTVSALARQLGVDWHTLMKAIRAHAADNLDGEPARGARLAGVDTLGVDEHIWRPSARHRDRAVTSIVDLTRDKHGQVHARLLDVTLGRSGPVYATWIRQQTRQFVASITHASLDPFRGYANAIRTELPDDTVTVLDAFHIVKLASTAMDEVRRRVQQDALGRRGHRDDPLYRIRRLLTTARENLTDRGRARLEAALQAGDPNLEVTVAWHAYQDLRSMFHASTPPVGRAVAERVLNSFHRCPIPEIARLGRTLRSWRAEVLAYFNDDLRRHGISNGGTEAINLIIEKTRRLAHGFRNFTNYRIRILLAADGTRPWRHRRRRSG